MSECIAFGPWMPHALLAALFLGAAVGFSLRTGLDRAELAAYRQISKRAAERGDV